MDGQVYRDMELRKLPPRFRTRIAQLLDTGDDWKKLMSSVPSEANPMVPKYRSEHILLIERHAFGSRRSCTEVLLDEWGTSGRRRPTLETLYNLLQACELFRAADYIAQEILEIPPPPRPVEGPARRITDDCAPEPQVLVKAPNDNLIDLELMKPVSEQVTLALKTATESAAQRTTDRDGEKLINFPNELLTRATANFDARFRVGSGSFGTVYKLNLANRRSPLAVKLLNRMNSLAEEQFLTEVNVLSRFQHENLVSLIGYSASGPQYCLIYEYLAGGTLMEALARTTEVLTWAARHHIAHGVVKGINYLHSAFDRPLIHRDIKSANILLDEASKPKIGDFGLAKSFSNAAQTSALASTIFGTSAYMAPEAFRGDISVKMDVFSFGVILLEIITGLAPYDENREGNDILTYLEESVEDDNILPWVDPKPGHVNSIYICRLYGIAQNCLSEKKKRPTSDALLSEFNTLVFDAR